MKNNRYNFIVEKIGEGLTLKSIGKLLNLSHQRISQIVNNYKPLLKKNRDRILERDNFRCQLENYCNGKKTKELQVHHIDGNSNNNEENNLITLCKKCHKAMDRIMKEERGYTTLRKGKKKMVETSKKCLNCDNLIYGVGIAIKNRKYCSKKCFNIIRGGDYSNETKDERRMRKSKAIVKYIMNRYRTDSEYREKVLKRNREYVLKKKQQLLTNK